jgi:hypothetical protein
MPFAELTHLSTASGAHTPNEHYARGSTRASRSSSVHRTFTLARNAQTFLRVYKYTRPPGMTLSTSHVRQDSTVRGCDRLILSGGSRTLKGRTGRGDLGWQRLDTGSHS